MCIRKISNKVNIKEKTMMNLIKAASRRSDIQELAFINESDDLENKVYKIKKLKMSITGYRIV